MSDKSDYIAVFDSGVGGVSVLRELLRLMPQERYLYFGDSANAPYGTRSTSEVRTLTLAAAAQLMARGCKALVVACNTATAAAIKDLREIYPDKIIIGIEPALKVAADHFPGKEVGVMATPVTLREEKFELLLHRFADICTVHKIPAPGLAELVERGMADSPETEALLRPLLAPHKDRLAAVVLGCTHYSFLREAIGTHFLPGTPILDGNEGTVRQLARRLDAIDARRAEGEGQVWLRTSSDDAAVIDKMKRLLAM